jgi:tape measure domain-containing protein
MSNLNVKLIFTAVTDQVKSAIDGVKGKFGELSGSADSSLNTVQQRINSSVSGVLSLGAAVKALAAGFSLLALGNSIRGLVEMADGMRLVEGRVKNASAGAVDFAKNYTALVGISMQTGTALAENANMFARIIPGLKEMGGNSQDALRQVDLLAKGLKISGAAQSESAAVVRQWSQAMASGVLRGDEFNSIMENSPRLSRAMADGLHVNVGELRAWQRRVS